MSIERLFLAITLLVTGFICGCLFTMASFGQHNISTIPHAVPRAANVSKKVNSTTKTIITAKIKSNVTVYKMDVENWHVDDNICFNLPSFLKTSLRTPAGLTPIFIHEPRNDKHVSGSIHRSGVWEGANINIIFSLLKADSEYNFIDLGANIGVFTLSVAKLGRKVIAVDPLSINLKRMCASIKAGNLMDKVTLIDNALSDVRENVTLMIDKGNVGGTFVAKDKNPNKERGSNVGGSFGGQVQTMKLDDLLKLPNFNFKKVVIKMDVEGYENRVFRGGENFFKTVHVSAILMEWLWLRTGPAGSEIIDFLTKHGFVPTKPSIARQNLDVKQRQIWPNDVLWRRK